MRENRSSLLLIVSLLLFLMSFVILCTWGYNEYYGNREKSKSTGIVKGDSATIAKAARDAANATRDSLQKIFIATIKQLDKRFDSTLNFASSIQTPLQERLNEFFLLKTEISDILKDRDNDADLGLARQKITELQKKINELAGRNTEVEQENKRLYALLKQLSAENKVPEQNARPVSFENKPETKAAPEKNLGVENVFMAYDLRLSAFTIADNKELETYQAMETDKFIGSFVVKNNHALNNVAEVFIIIVQPDGHVLQKSTWESGTFETLEGRKIYSCKLRFDYTKGEPKKLLFSISSEKFMKGNYTMQVYYNGSVIGKMSKSLN